MRQKKPPVSVVIAVAAALAGVLFLFVRAALLLSDGGTSEWIFTDMGREEGLVGAIDDAASRFFDDLYGPEYDPQAQS